MELQLSLIQKILQTFDEELLISVEKNLSQTPAKSPTKPVKTKKKINIGDPEHPYYNKLRPSEVEGLKEAMEDYEAGRYKSFKNTEEMIKYFENLNLQD